MATNWREFEELVSQIEKQLAPKGAIIKSPDRIKDKVTGKLREVDASIRSTIGSAPILITIECRKRGRKQDDTWIEQLAKKKEKIGADLTIAVVSSDFTESAVKSAIHYNIQLRRLKDISSAEISTWIQDIHIQRIKLHDVIEKWAMETEEEGEKFQFSKEILRDIEADPINSKIIFKVEDDLGVSVQDLVNSFYRWQYDGKLSQDAYTGIASEDEFIRRRITASFGSKSFYTISSKGNFYVTLVEIDLVSKIERETIPFSSVHQYSDLTNEITHIASGSFFVGPNSEDEYRFFVQPEKPIDNKDNESQE